MSKEYIVSERKNSSKEVYVIVKFFNRFSIDFM